MIQQINNLPANMVGFRASGEVTEEDFKNVVIPQVGKLVEKTGKLNYMLVLDTPIKEFTAGAWMQDAWLGIKNLTKWHKAAIITDSESVKTFTDVFSKFMIGEFRAFEKSQQDQAVAWVSSETGA